MDLLKFSIIGDVDNGKSTLVGRLLYDTKSIFQDNLAQVSLESKNTNHKLNLALFTDGLRKERENGITIDVAYRYFSTENRSFILADCPGHVKYTKNMITGSSKVDVAVILVDAQLGFSEQTKRHLFITSLMGIKHLVICINKMDKLNYEKQVFDDLANEIKQFLIKLNISEIHFIPISALKGDNIVNGSENIDWYKGPTLLYFLETITVSEQNYVDARLPISLVIDSNLRQYAGRISSGVFRVGDKIKTFPGGNETYIEKIQTPNGFSQQASYMQSVLITLKDSIKLKRGSMISRVNNQPSVVQELDIIAVWMCDNDFNDIEIKHTTNTVDAKIKVFYKIDINTLHRSEVGELKSNDILRMKVRLNSPVFKDSYIRNRETGSVLLIDKNTTETLGAGLIN